MNVIFRGFTFRLQPDVHQKQIFCEHAGGCRLVWNLALEQRRDHWSRYRRTTGKVLSFGAQSKELTQLRAEVPFVKAVSQDAQQRTLKDLDTAFGRFFKGQGGYPRPKRKFLDDSFGFAGRGVQVEQLSDKWGRIFLPKAGWVKFRMTRPIEGRITEAVVRRTALGWDVSIGCKIEREIPVVAGEVGIDRGVAVPLMLSDGTIFVLPAIIAKIEVRHRRAQRKAARRVRSSNRWRRAIRRAACLKARQARIRKHWAHETTTAICRRFGTVVVEKLKTRNMTASAKGTIEAPGTNVAQKAGLNRSILNVGWYQIQTMLAYKANRLVLVDPRHTSQTCSCTDCGAGFNADHNAAINILRRGNTAVLDVEERQSAAPGEASTFKMAA